MDLSRFINSIVPLSLLAILTATGCTKFAPFDGESYSCECGSLTWGGRELGMRMAEVVPLDSTTFRYHMIADLRTEEELRDRIDSRDLILTLEASISGETTTLNLDAGDTRLTVLQVDAPDTSLPWLMQGAQMVVSTSDLTHDLSLTSLTVQRGGNVYSVSGEVTFTLED